jgi:2,3-bisphosphoglycerate-independent phosphoglycerate mutase
MRVTKDKTKDGCAVDYFEAGRIAYSNGHFLRKYIDSEIKDIAVINKAFKPIWEFTYKIVSGEENERVKVVNKDPHNLLLSWIPSGKIYCEELKVSNII